MKWTASRVELLKSRLNRKWKTSEIASSFGISPNAVSKKAQSLGLSLKDGKPLPPVKKSKAKPATRRERMTGNPDYAPQVPNPSTDVPAPVDPTAPVSKEELRSGGGLKMWGPHP